MGDDENYIEEGEEEARDEDQCSGMATDPGQASAQQQQQQAGIVMQTSAVAFVATPSSDALRTMVSPQAVQSQVPEPSPEVRVQAQSSAERMRARAAYWSEGGFVYPSSYWRTHIGTLFCSDSLESTRLSHEKPGTETDPAQVSLANAEPGTVTDSVSDTTDGDDEDRFKIVDGVFDNWKPNRAAIVEDCYLSMLLDVPSESDNDSIYDASQKSLIAELAESSDNEHMLEEVGTEKASARRS